MACGLPFGRPAQNGYADAPQIVDALRNAGRSRFDGPDDVQEALG
jgi:hypothetical protein